MRGFKLNATKNNIKNLVISTVILIVILILFLVIGLRTKVNYTNGGGSTTLLFIGFNGTSLTHNLERYGLNIFNNIKQLGVNTETRAIFPSAIIIVVISSLCFLMSLVGFALKEQYRSWKMALDVLTKIYSLAIVVLSIIIIAQFSTFVYDYNQSVLAPVSAKAKIDILTWVFVVIFGMAFPLAAIVINFNKQYYIRGSAKRY